MTPVRPLAASAAALAAALGIAGALAVPILAVPIPADAAPTAPCAGFAAQSGAELLGLTKLQLQTADEPVANVGVADAQSALIANAKVDSVAVTRMLNAADADPLTTSLLQQTPPTNPKPSLRTTGEGSAGPFTIGAGRLSSHAKWSAACSGPATRAETTVESAGLLGGGLVRVRKKAVTLSTTEADRNVGRSTAAASAGSIDLLGGAVHVNIKRAPTLTASIGAEGNGTVSYRPAIAEVSGKGIDPARLDTAGDYLEITLGDESTPDDQVSEGARSAGGTGRSGGSDGGSGLADGSRSADDSGSVPAGTPGSGSRSSGEPGHGESMPLGRVLDGLRGRKATGRISHGLPLPLPPVPGVPPVDGGPEDVQVAGPGTKLKISLGKVREASSGHAVAGRATAIRFLLTQQPEAASDRGTVLLDLDFGRLEAAAVAPAAVAVAAVGNTSPGVITAHSGGIPITGPRVSNLFFSGIALLTLGAAAVLAGNRRRTAPGGQTPRARSGQSAGRHHRKRP